MRHSIKNAAVAAGGGIALIVAVTAAAGAIGTAMLDGALAQSRRASELMRLHMAADMMHDAIRADVVSALLAAEMGDEARIAAARGELREHVDTFRTTIGKERTLAEPGVEIDTLNALATPLAAYAKQAEDIAAAAGSDARDAHAMLPTFESRFSELEDGMEKASDAFAAAEAKAEAQARGRAGAALAGIIGSGLLASFIGGFIFLRARRIAAALTRLADAAHLLKRGDLESKIGDQTRDDEIGGTAAALAELQTSLKKGVETARIATFKGAAFEGSPTAMMIVDRDFKVTFINAATKALFRTHGEIFAKAFPGFDPERIIGASIDIFHKNPAHQRQLLADPKRLPYHADISILDLKIALNISGVFDEKGEYAGNILEWADVTETRTQAGILSAIARTQALVEFTLDGAVLRANDNFLNAMGYSADEIKGRPHSIFVDPAFRSSTEYREFWDALRRGEPASGRFQRVGKNGKPVHIEGAYVPVLDSSGKAFKVVKIASDVTAFEAARAKAEAERADAAANQAKVVAALADGLNRLSAGDFSTNIVSPFTEDYEQLRRDFNAAVEKLRIGEEDRARHEAAQATVVEKLATGLKNLAKGDLSRAIDEAFSKEYEGLREDFNETIETLKDTMIIIAATADGIASGVKQIGAAADDLSQRTENQAATLEETAAALDEVTAAVKQTASRAAEANASVGAARNEAEKTEVVVKNAVEAMSEIEKSSGQISQIIGVIDDIAFQTSLLALNAGVEAARAGDAGRGFAVVAQEVRGLAQRSSVAAKEIKALIATSEDHVESGVDLVRGVGEALTQILSRVDEATRLVGEIAHSAKEQSTSLGEVNSAVNSIDETTQQNAAMVEETTAATHSLTTDAQELSSKIRRFNLGVERRRGVAPERATLSETMKAKEAEADVPPVHAQRRRVAAAVGGARAARADNDWQDF